MPEPAEHAAIAENYDAIAYDALPYPLSHPDHLAAIAVMFGLDPTPPADAISPPKPSAVQPVAPEKS